MVNVLKTYSLWKFFVIIFAFWAGITYIVLLTAAGEDDDTFACCKLPVFACWVASSRCRRNFINGIRFVAI